MRALLPFFLLLYTVAVSQGKKLTAETTVQQVTIFSSGAQVHRIANVLVQPGRTEIAFPELSSQLQQQSVQLKADANITLISVSTAKDHFVQRKIEQDERSLIERRNDLQEKNETDGKLLQVYKNEEQMLIKNQAIGGQTGVKAEELKLALDLHRQRLTEVYQKQMEIEKRIRQQVLELDRTNAQISEVSKKRDSIKYTVTAIIESKESKNIKLELLYTVSDAGWYPTYDIRVVDVQHPLDVLMNANVFQRSGETWKDVAIQLSSGNPTDNATPPTVQTWWLGYYDPSISFMRNSSTPATVAGRILNTEGQPLSGATVAIKGSTNITVTDANGFFKLNGVASNAIVVVSYVGYQTKEIMGKSGYYTINLNQSTQNMEEVVVTGYGTRRDTDGTTDVAFKDRRKDEIQTVTVNTQYQPTTIVYKIDEKYTLETDGKTTTIGIKKIDIGALYEYFAVPKIDPSVFLTAKITNWQSYDLQSGEASLYYEGTYLGKTYIDLSTTGDTLQLSLGKDNSVVISRKLLKEFSAKKFLGGNKTEKREFEIAVRNTKRLPVNIVIQDQFPISTTKEIEVNDTNAPEAQVDKGTGVINWNLSLPAGQEKKLQMSYEVKYPKDRRVTLN